MGEQPRTRMASEGAFGVWLFIGIMKVSSHAMMRQPRRLAVPRNYHLNSHLV